MIQCGTKMGDLPEYPLENKMYIFAIRKHMIHIIPNIHVNHTAFSYSGIFIHPSGLHTFILLMRCVVTTGLILLLLLLMDGIESKERKEKVLPWTYCFSVCVCVRVSRREPGPGDSDHNNNWDEKTFQTSPMAIYSDFPTGNFREKVYLHSCWCCVCVRSRAFVVFRNFVSSPPTLFFSICLQLLRSLFKA